MPAGVNAGVLCLDFANTLEPGADGGRDRDHLGRDYAGLLRWARYAGTIEVATERDLTDRSEDSPGRAGRVVTDAHRLRTAIIVVFSAVATGEQPDRTGLRHIRDAYAGAVAAGELVGGLDGLRWSWWWSWSRSDLAAPVRPIAVSAAELLTGGRLSRVKQCHGDRCRTLFLDTTKNASRRWCLMRHCGNVQKSRRQATARRAARR